MDNDKIKQAHDIYAKFLEGFLERLSGHWGDEHLTIEQIRLLFAMRSLKSATIGEIAAKLHIGQSAASHLVNSLFKKNLISRYDNPEDRRKAIVKLTSGGETLAGHGRKGHVSSWLKKLDDKQIDMFIEIFKSLIRLKENKDVEL
jgi:DNA-binding MarR family transcriptional regulator